MCQSPILDKLLNFNHIENLNLNFSCKLQETGNISGFSACHGKHRQMKFYLKRLHPFIGKMPHLAVNL